MRFVEVARFSDLTEPHVAASALRASGIPVILHRECLSQLHFTLLQALGGVGLWVPEDQAANARAFLDDVRRQPSGQEPLPPVEAGLRTFFSLALTILTGMVVPLLPRRFRGLRDEQPAE